MFGSCSANHMKSDCRSTRAWRVSFADHFRKSRQPPTRSTRQETNTYKNGSCLSSTGERYSLVESSFWNARPSHQPSRQTTTDPSTSIQAINSYYLTNSSSTCQSTASGIPNIYQEAQSHPQLSRSTITSHVHRQTLRLGMA